MDRTVASSSISTPNHSPTFIAAAEKFVGSRWSLAQVSLNLPQAEKPKLARQFSRHSTQDDRILEAFFRIFPTEFWTLMVDVTNERMTDRLSASSRRRLMTPVQILHLVQAIAAEIWMDETSSNRTGSIESHFDELPNKPYGAAR